MDSLDVTPFGDGEDKTTDQQISESTSEYLSQFAGLDPLILEEAIAGVKAAELRGGLDITGTMIETTNVVRTKSLKIFNDASWIFKDIHKYRWIGIAAEELIIDDEAGYGTGTICRPLGSSADKAYAKLLFGKPGDDGDNGDNATGRHPNGDGKNGDPGFVGTTGMDGDVIDLPPILIFSETVRLGSMTQPQHKCLRIVVTGINGGTGGTGGKGGHGGAGSKGRTGVDETFPLPPFCNCKRGPGTGGAGGVGGLPGRGGRPGRGGNGGGVYFFGTPAELDMFKFFAVEQEPGKAGPLGGPGLGGLGGAGAGGADGTICCNGGPPGKDRRDKRAKYKDGGLGKPAEGVGIRGGLDYIVRDNSDLF